MDAHLVLTVGTIPQVCRREGGFPAVGGGLLGKPHGNPHTKGGSEGRSTGCLLGLRFNTRVTCVSPFLSLGVGEYRYI